MLAYTNDQRATPTAIHVLVHERLHPHLFILLQQTKDDPEIKDKYHIYLCDEADATLWNVVMPSDSFLEMAPDMFHGLEQNASRFHRAAQVKLEIRFPLQYPSGPPFVRVTSPRFKQ